MPDEKIKFLMRIDPDTDRKIKAAMPMANCRSQNELRELRGRCIQEVNKTHGMISLDDAVEYQNGGE